MPNFASDPSFAQLEGLTADLRRPVRRFADWLAATCADQLLSLAMYGPVVSGDWPAGKRLARSAMVLRAIDLELLRRLALEGSQFEPDRLAPPIVLTPESIEHSRDTFALELLEIQQGRFVVLGDDHFASLTFDRDHVRLQCERELRVIAVAMRQGLLASGGGDERLGALSTDLTHSLLRVLGGLVWLEGAPHPGRVFSLVAEVEKLSGQALSGVYSALDRSDTAGWHKFRRLYADIEALEKFADGL
jgi:hypothetical protein